MEQLLTESRNNRTKNLDQCSTIEIIQLMNEEEKTVDLAIENQEKNIEAVITEITKCLEQKGRLIYVGAGTSGRLGVLDAAECIPTFGVSKNQVIGVLAGGNKAFVEAIEGVEDDFNQGSSDLEALKISSNDIVVGIAASGRTPYVLGALNYAKEKNAQTVALACNKDSEIGKCAQLKIELDVGPEVLSGSTRLKSGTAQKKVLNMLSTISMIRIGKVYENLMVDVKATNKKLKRRAERILSTVGEISLEEAQQILSRTDYQLKLAILMVKKNLEMKEAKQLLASKNGFLRAALED
ncbi:N-acetylmuramic acid 6-phosphate etherase [Oceanobacillus neutriphilus]|uniref:N-acetylmuramic acid 6-phosphate etherase n=1 Tax=Oceanobacillus neutriphilus TaxID=531815 RepID=A0ABQ2NRD0_9BACI|nr:N-acetylmuramic acid 6-phosphate etherase [Oceanobacillus neutriphilus]GGP07773.1 N-acetylmuramic acid 6-phosphate etherase [Oceanobacillus neutriphilus]